MSDEEIEQYYERKVRQLPFEAKHRPVPLSPKLPKASPGVASFRRNIRNYPNSNLEDVKDYTYQYAINSFTDEDIWINFDEVISDTPLKEVNNQTEFLESSTFSETSDEEYLYFLKILEFKISDDLSPLEFIREDIENIIINKRKIALKKELEEAIYDEALENQSFEIYSR